VGKSTLDLDKITGEIKVIIKRDVSEVMEIRDQRRHPRLKKNFEVTLHKGIPGKQDLLLKGNTLDLSQGGAFIKTEGWHLLESAELTELTFIFPTYFTGKDTSSGLQGAAIVRRVDRLREGVAVEFIQELRQFRPIAVC
jgi:hypothetical protein